MDTMKRDELFDWSHNWCDATKQVDLGNIITCYRANVLDVDRKRQNRVSVELYYFWISADCRNMKFGRRKIGVWQSITKRVLMMRNEWYVAFLRSWFPFLVTHDLQLNYKECPRTLEEQMVCSFIGQHGSESTGRRNILVKGWQCANTIWNTDWDPTARRNQTK
jgi:hypothetical protein